MTSYNREKFIGQAIDSILEQKRNFPIEIIVGDDLSTDKTREILTEYAKRYPDIMVLNFQKEDIGVGPNWASTCKLARGKYLAFLDDDDYWCDSHRLQQMVDTLDTYQEYGIVHTSYYVLDMATGKQSICNTHMPESLKGVERIKYLFEVGLPNLFSTTMIRKSLMDKYVDLDAYIRLQFGLQDWPTMLSLVPYCEIYWIEQPSVVYRIQSGSVSHQVNYVRIKERLDRDKTAMLYICPRIGVDISEEGIERCNNQVLLGVAYNNGDYKRAREFASRANFSIKSLCAYTWLTFQIFRVLKQLRRYIKK